MSDRIVIENLRIKIDEETTLDLSPDKARRLRDALMELFPTPVVQPIYINRESREWPFYRWEPYYWTAGSTDQVTQDQIYNGTTGYEPKTLFCNVDV